jgi:hypothetical protein
VVDFVFVGGSMRGMIACLLGVHPGAPGISYVTESKTGAP